MPLPISPQTACSFVILYEHGSRNQIDATLESVADFARRTRPTIPNSFELIVACGPSRKGPLDSVAFEAFERASVLDEKHWAEIDFDPSWPIGFNLADTALRRVFYDVVVFIACGSRIVDEARLAEALSLADRNRRIAILSAAMTLGGRLSANGIVFQNRGITLPCLVTASKGVVIDIRKRFFGGMRLQEAGTVEPISYSDIHVIAAIAYDYQQDFHNTGRRSILNPWAE